VSTFLVWLVLTIAELLEAVRVNLRAKVAALADDDWMYHGEQ
jgi:hypothetical protein